MIIPQNRKRLLLASLMVGLASAHVGAAELSVSDVSMLAGTGADVVVSGVLMGEAAFGYTILVEIVPRAGSTGSVTFTPSPPSDVVQTGDPWPGAGMFSAFDTDSPGFSASVNGAVDDNGVFTCDTPGFTGVLVTFPCVATTDAAGVWDVVLSTSVGDSAWECVSTPVTTTLIAGTITVSQAECLLDTDCNDGVPCTDDTCVSGSCVFTPNDANCPGDGVFCNGAEVCDAVQDCIPPGDPCQPGEFCNETTDTCDQCQVDADCNDGVGCTDDTCTSGSCVFTVNNANCPDDGAFCNGTELCDPASDCISTGDPCSAGMICDEPSDSCVACTTGAECDDGNVCTDDACNAGLCEYTNNTAPCDDGLFCTATDVCGGGVCAGSGDPCAPQLCDETNDVCLAETASLTVSDLVLSRGGTDELLVSGAIAGDSTFGVTIMVEIVPRAGVVGSVTFTPSPPADIVQRGDPWPGAGIFTAFDADSPGFSNMLNGSVDDDGSFVGTPVTYSGPLTGFPVTASADAGGIWDVLLTTAAGDSSWEGVNTTLSAGTISVAPPASLSVFSRSMPPGSSSSVVVSGTIDGATTSNVSVLLEIVARPNNLGTLEFTLSPPPDIVQLGDPWGGAGTFSAFDTDSAGFSSTLNGTVHGTFTPQAVIFSGDLSEFPVQASFDADGVWDLVLSTSVGDSGWDGVLTALAAGTVTVSPSACILDTDCDDANPCTDDRCSAVGMCEYTNNTVPCDDGDLCTANDTCGGGVCAGTAIPEGGACDDGDPCNIGETCQSGVCTGGAPPDCSTAGDACNTASCDPVGVEGNCDILTPANEAGACDDGDSCNVGETCLSGLCQGGGPVDCTAAGDACNVASCDPTGVEGNCDIVAPTNEGGACEDGDLCTQGETCLNGSCLPGSTVDCTGLTDACNIGACNSLTGLCQAITVNEGGPCDDGDACTRNDVCASGVCAGTPTDCSGLTDSCNIGTCNVSSGACEAIPTNEGGTCDDADPCTSGDMCTAGVCAGTPIPGCQNCTIDSDCDDANVCTADACSAGVCTRTNLGGPCNDGDLCTVGDACSAGTCAGTPVDCSGLNDACNLGVCEATTGVCRAQPVNEGGTCDDGLACTVNDVCSAGTCSGTLVGSPSVDLLWSPATQLVQVGQTFQIDLVAASGTCVDQPVGSIEVILNWDPVLIELVGHTDTGPIPWLISGFPDDSGLDGLNAPFGGLPANDGDALYQALSGFPSGAVVPPGGVVVTTFQFRALDGTQGTQVAIAAAAGSLTQTRVLGAGDTLGMDITGTFGPAAVEIDECQNASECADGNVCTDDMCNGGVCEYTNNTQPCDDGMFCTANDVCASGLCAGAGNPCTAPLLCSEILDACVECLSGADCDDGNLCTDDVCDAAGTCSNPSNTLSCDDGQFCTAVDTCSGGVCVGGVDACPNQVCDETNDRCVDCLVDNDCDDANVCTDDFCTSNLCQHVVNTLPCDDGLFCTVTDVCVDGSCIGSVNPCTSPLICSEVLNACVQCEVDADCDDGNLCTTDVCLFNVCSNTNNTAPCDDGLFCTTTDVCSGGVCVGSGDPCPGQLCDEANAGCVDCFTAADCPGDGVGCTVDACVGGTCVYPPDDTLCDDGLFCNGPEFCHSTFDCQPAESPCDDPNLCNEANDSCGCQEPVVAAEGSRYLAVTPRPGSTPVALLVTGLDLGVSCLSLYVQADGMLGPTPVFKPPSGPTGWGTAHVHGLEVIPSTTYAVETECDTGQGMGRSTAASDTTWVWGDTDNSGGLVTILDVTWVIDGFRAIFTDITIFNVDLWGVTPDDCLPQLVIDILDITKCLDAFKQFPFPCDDPCP